MRDILEMMEDAAESQFYNMTEGLPEGKFKCGCGRIEDLNNASPASSNPFSQMICRECVKNVY